MVQKRDHQGFLGIEKSFKTIGKVLLYPINYLIKLSFKNSHYDFLKAERDKYFKMAQEISLENKKLKLYISNHPGRERKLEQRICELDGLCRNQKKVINKSRNDSRKNYRNFLTEVENLFKERAEKNDSKLSYIVIAGPEKIIASTPKFRENFHFEADKIDGAKYYKFFKIPEDAPDHITEKNLKKAFKDPSRIKLQTTIINGKGKEKIIVFEKEEPIHISDYFYTVVHIHEIGYCKRTLKKVLRRLHVIKGKESETISEFLQQQAIKETKQGAEKEKHRISLRFLHRKKKKKPK